MPPSRARAIASRPSVTVSIAALTIGTLSIILRVKRVCVETSRGRTEEAAGTMRTSSKVRPSLANFSSKVPGLLPTDIIAISSLKNRRGRPCVCLPGASPPFEPQADARPASTEKKRPAHVLRTLDRHRACHRDEVKPHLSQLHEPRLAGWGEPDPY